MIHLNDEDLETSASWMETVPHIVILDPDGWDRSNFEFSFYNELITYDEFNRRLTHSTIYHKDNNPELKKYQLNVSNALTKMLIKAKARTELTNNTAYVNFVNELIYDFKKELKM